MPGFNVGIPGSHNINALWTWGAAVAGGLGNNTTTPDVSTPAARGNFTDWEKLSASFAFQLGIRNGQLYGWGQNNTSYQLGLGDTTGRLVPTLIDSGPGWQMVSAGGSSAGIKDGKLYTWGANANYRTGQGTNTGTTNVPTQVGSNTDWTWVNAGTDATAAIRAGRLYTTGVNTTHQTLQGTSTGDTNGFTQVGSDTDWESISLGGESGTTIRAVLAIKGGKLFTWGSHTQGQTAANTRSGTATTATQRGSDTDWSLISAATGASIGAGIRSGRLYTWGPNFNFRTAQGTDTGYTIVITQVGSETTWSSTVVGWSFGFAIRSNQAYSWGTNANGKTGQGTTTGSTNGPVQIGTQRDWKKVPESSGGTQTTGAIKG
jgi:alpha-tubulin suppressor-like RCC1 family protein